MKMLLYSDRTLHTPILFLRAGVVPDYEPRLTEGRRVIAVDPDVEAVRRGDQGRQGKAHAGHYVTIFK